MSYTIFQYCILNFFIFLCVSVGHADSAFKHCKLTHESLKEMNSKQVADVSSLVKSACDNNEQHDGEVESARTAAEEDVTKNSDEIIQQIDGKFSLSYAMISLS